MNKINLSGINRLFFNISRCIIMKCLIWNMLHASDNLKPPNFLLILTDDQGWSQVSTQVHPDIPESYSTYLNTPNMNRLAIEGMRFTSGYAPGSTCTPTRRAILCGTSTARSGGAFPSAWDPGQKMTIPKALKQANENYRCAHFGKWGENMTSSPEQCGYDVSDGETGNITGHTIKENNDTKNKIYVSDDPKLTRSVSERAIQFMREQTEKKKPFFVQVSYYAVHLKVELLQETLNNYLKKGSADRKYTSEWAGMLEDLDEGVGQLLSALNDLGVQENTYVVFMSDNGGRGTVPGSNAKKEVPTNYPLSGTKSTIYEGGFRVPFFIRGPEIKEGTFSHTPVAGYDLLPTFYDLAGGTVSLPDYIDGGSLSPLFQDPGKAKVERQLDGLVFHRPKSRQGAFRQGDYKLIVKYNDQNGEVISRQLFNLSLDIGETKDLSKGDMSHYADRLQELLTQHWATLDPKVLGIKSKTKS